MQTSLSKKHERGKMAMTVAFAVICIVYLLPILIVLMNSFKSNAAVNTETFALPNADSFVGFQNYVKGMTFGNYPFVKAVFYSLFITLVSSALILLCTSMAAWYVSRVGSLVSKIAVSYTHLDVYKRQERGTPPSPPASRSGGPCR